MSKSTIKDYLRWPHPLALWLMPISGLLIVLLPSSLFREKAVHSGLLFNSFMLWPTWLLWLLFMLVFGACLIHKTQGNHQRRMLGKVFNTAALSFFVFLVWGVIQDNNALIGLMNLHGQGFLAAKLIQNYVGLHAIVLSLLWLTAAVLWTVTLWTYSWESELQQLLRRFRFNALLSPLFILLPLPLMGTYLVKPPVLLSSPTWIYLVVALLMWSLPQVCYLPPKQETTSVSHEQGYLEGLIWLGVGLVEACIILTAIGCLYVHQNVGMNVWSSSFSLKPVMLTLATPMGLLLAGLFSIAGFRRYRYRQAFTKASTEQDSIFGSAEFANTTNLQDYGYYDDKTDSIISGQDDKGRYIHLPLQNKLTISPAGGGKTTTSSIPVLLSYDGPVFVFDVKAELWATTARHRYEVFGREIVTIDPYGITKSPDFAKGKPDALLKDYHINPFDFIPEDLHERDRMLNAFAASFIINEGGTVKHFDENAKILVRGYIDYMMQALPVEARKMQLLFQLLSEPHEKAQLTFQHMGEYAGRASAAATQIGRVGADERGSILSTSYRQIDWMSDSNIQATLADSNFHLPDFIKGNMDIYVVLPEDQVVEHSRLVRMLMALIKSLVVQANPSDLPNKKILCLLDELAQLGYCPDVEQFIEVMRARGLVMWMVFQTLNQVEQFQKPDLIKGATIKQIFTNDDVPTMEWIQKLGGKKTVLSKSISKNKGSTSQSNNMFSGSSSKGEGEGMQETATDLIQLNEIRELSKDEQWLFVQGKKPIKCKKVRYFEYPPFADRFDDNPVERYR